METIQTEEKMDLTHSISKPRKRNKEKDAAYSIAYMKKNIKRAIVQLNRKTEPDLSAWCESHQPFATYVKDLIRRDIEEQGLVYDNERGEFVPINDSADE